MTHIVICNDKKFSCFQLKAAARLDCKAYVLEYQQIYTLPKPYLNSGQRSVKPPVCKAQTRWSEKTPPHRHVT